MRWRPALAIFLPVVVILWIATIGAQTPPPELCVDPNDRERLRLLALEAFDKSFRENAESLMQNWIRDPRQQPERAMAGMDKTIRVYIHARASALTWNPPTC